MLRDEADSLASILLWLTRPVLSKQSHVHTHTATPNVNSLLSHVSCFTLYYFSFLYLPVYVSQVDKTDTTYHLTHDTSDYLCKPCGRWGFSSVTNNRKTPHWGYKVFQFSPLIGLPVLINTLDDSGHNNSPTTIMSNKQLNNKLLRNTKNTIMKSYHLKD